MSTKQMLTVLVGSHASLCVANIRTLRRVDVHLEPATENRPHNDSSALKTPSFHPVPFGRRWKHVKCISAAACLGTFSVSRCHRCSYGLLARHMKVMDESFPLPGRGPELNWKILFIPPVCRHGIRFVYNWFKPEEGGKGFFCGTKAKVFRLMEEMIEFV